LSYEAKQQWINLEDETWIDGKKHSWRKLLGPDCPKPVIVQALDGTPHYLLPKEETLKWAVEKGLKWAKQEQAARSPQRRSPAERERMRKAVRDEKVRKNVVWLTADSVAKGMTLPALKKLWDKPDLWRTLIATLLSKSYSD